MDNLLFKKNPSKLITMGITLTMKLLTHESKFFKKIDTLCDQKKLILLLYTILREILFHILMFQHVSSIARDT